MLPERKRWTEQIYFMDRKAEADALVLINNKIRHEGVDWRIYCLLLFFLLLLSPASCMGGHSCYYSICPESMFDSVLSEDRSIFVPGHIQFWYKLTGVCMCV